jgi:hypothetical protein
MAVLTTIVAALAVGLGLNFLLLLGVLRRLRIVGTTRSSSEVDMPAVGKPLASFAIETVDGRVIDSAFFTPGPVLLGFFARGCEACERAKAEISSRPPSEPFLALVRTDDPTNPLDLELVRDLSKSGALVATYPMESEIMRQVGARVFPTLIRVEKGIVTDASSRLRDVVNGGGRLKSRRGHPWRAVGRDASPA